MNTLELFSGTKSFSKIAKRRESTGTQGRGNGGLYGWLERAKIPPALFLEIFRGLEL